MNYDAFRFGVIWFYLLPVWTAIALVADWQAYREHDSEKPGWLLFSAGPLRLLVLVSLLAFAGLHFLALLYFPFLLLPYCVSPSRLKAKPLSQARSAFAPNWLRRAAKAMAVLLALSVVPSYWMFPMMANEGQIRAIVSRTRSNEKQFATWLDAYSAQFQAFPPELLGLAEGHSLASIDTHALKEMQVMTGDEKTEWYLKDPFAHRVRELWTPAYWAVFFPLRAFHGGRKWPAVEGDRMMFSKLQYSRVGDGFVLWSRGPDAEFAPGFREAVMARAGGSTAATVALANMTYDPTNGTLSAGDIFLVGPKDLFKDSEGHRGIHY